MLSQECFGRPTLPLARQHITIYRLTLLSHTSVQHFYAAPLHIFFPNMSLQHTIFSLKISPRHLSTTLLYKTFLPNPRPDVLYVFADGGVRGCQRWRRRRKRRRRRRRRRYCLKSLPFGACVTDVLKKFQGVMFSHGWRTIVVPSYF